MFWSCSRPYKYLILSITYKWSNLASVEWGVRVPYNRSVQYQSLLEGNCTGHSWCVGAWSIEISVYSLPTVKKIWQNFFYLVTQLLWKQYRAISHENVTNNNIMRPHVRLWGAVKCCWYGAEKLSLCVYIVKYWHSASYWVGET